MKIKHTLCMLLFLVATLFVYALDSQVVMVPASGESVIPQQNRESYFSHSAGTADYSLYGSDKWAVRFNLRSAYPGVSNCSFSIQKARLYFPNVGDSVNVSLYSDANSLPSQLITSAKAAVVSNLQDISFPQIVQADVIWLVVDYATNFQNRFVAASAGDGTHSYYLNTNAITPYLQNFSLAGFNCELLFGLLGNFNLSNPDLQLVSFDLSGTLRPRETAKPIFSIYNHSDVPVMDAHIQLEITAPTTDYSVSQTIVISETIEPRSLLEVLAPGYQDYIVNMPLTPMQLRIQATLGNSLAETDTTLANNTVSKYYSVYSYAYPIFPVENFIRYNTTSTICGAQDGYPKPGFHALLYYANLSDSLSNLGAYQRLTWYDFNAMPTTAIIGKERIIGYNAAEYLSKYQAAVDKANLKRSFISSSSCVLEEETGSTNLSIKIQLTNSNTRLYTVAALNPAMSSRFFVGVFKKAMFSGQQRYVFDRWIAFADTISSTMNYGSTTTKNYTMSLINLSLEQLQANYRIYYWLQGTQGGIVQYANFTAFAFANTGLVDEAMVPPLSLAAFPNPLRTGNSLKLIGMPDHGTISVYNIRGQCIWQTTDFTRGTDIQTDLFPSSGLYFIKSESLDGLHKQTIKISIIK
ncbi:MAG: T9SS type A sorting domain-containing protein [Candidatus Cloacimonetes bacterium]|nr:T9SS type A sorting domain-containing protein [Candidatus Cloacimonadota bacterium]MDD3235172.1 T9SS type A sorting domain-containing protein [Candidatus Cloacimonadota bacterium]